MKTPQETFSIIFWVRKSKVNTEGKSPLNCRITVNGERAEIFLKKYVSAAKWNAEKQEISGKDADVKEINDYLIKVRHDLNRSHTKMLNDGKIVSSKDLRDEFMGVTSKQTGLIEISKSCLSFLQNEIGKSYAPGTVKNYFTTVKLLEEFVKVKYKRSDLDIRQVKPSFVLDLSAISPQKLRRKCVIKTVT